MAKQKKQIKIQIVKCDESRVKEASDLIQGILNQEFPDETEAYPPHDLGNLLDSYGKLGEAFFIAICDNQVVGTVAVKREDDRVALLRRLFAHPDFRGSGIGEKLIERAVEFCKEVGYDELMFKTTSTMVKAIKLCEHKNRKRFNEKMYLFEI